MGPSPMEGAFNPVERVVVPVQGTDREFFAQQWAIEFAAALGVPVYAIHVGAPDEEPNEDIFRFVASLGEKWGVTLETRQVESDDVTREIVDELRTRDLVVIGTRKLSGDYHVGSIAAELVRRAPCPVQIVRIA